MLRGIGPVCTMVVSHGPVGTPHFPCEVSYGKCSFPRDRGKQPHHEVRPGRWQGGVVGSQRRVGRLLVHEYGDPGKPVLLLLHGITDSGQCFPDLVARLGSSYRIVAPDALAHGGSERFTDEEMASEDPIEAMYDATEARARGHRSGAACSGTRWVAPWPGRWPRAGRTWCVRWSSRTRPGWTRRRGATRRTRTSSAWTGPGPSAADPASADHTVPRGEPDLAGERATARGRRGRPTSTRRSCAPGSACSGTPWREIAAAIEPPTLVVTGDQEVILHGDAARGGRPPEPAVRRTGRRRRSPLRTPRPRRCLPRARRPVAGRAAGERRQPPATAGMMLIWVPSGVVLSRPSRKRTSSLPT